MVKFPKFFQNNDKRKSDRIRVKLPVFYLLVPSSSWTQPLVLHDIGGGGLSFISRYRIKKNSVLALQICLPDEKPPILCKGDAIWCKSLIKKNAYHVGIKFHAMASPDRQRYVMYVCEQLLNKHLTPTGRIKKVK